MILPRYKKIKFWSYVFVFFCGFVGGLCGQLLVIHVPKVCVIKIVKRNIGIIA